MKLSSAYIQEQLQKEYQTIGQEGMTGKNAPDLSETAVIDSVQRIYDACDEWENQLREEVMRGRSLQRILKLSADFIGNPLLVMSLDFNLLGESGIEVMPEKSRLFHKDGIDME